MSDPLEAVHIHERLIRREEERSLLVAAIGFVNIPHLIVIDGTPVTYGDGPFPEPEGDAWVLPAGVWAAQIAVTAVGLSTDPPAAALLRADPDRGALLPIYDVSAHFEFAGPSNVAGEEGHLGGQLELGPLVSDGGLRVWAEGDASVEQIALVRLA